MPAQIERCCCRGGLNCTSSEVVSYDGGGDDGLYNVFYGTGHTVQRIGRLTANFAGASEPAELRL